MTARTRFRASDKSGAGPGSAFATRMLWADSNRAIRRPEALARVTQRSYTGVILSGSDGMPKYKVGKKLGDGGFAHIYFGESLKPQERGKRVAIKALQQGLEDPSAKERIVNEGMYLQSCVHPNILECFGMFNQEGTIFLVLEFLDGDVLSDLIDSGAPFDPVIAVAYTSPVLDALDHMHDLGIVHRDLKPENVFICDDTVKLLDLGIAKPSGPQTGIPLTAEGAVVGSPEYMAPEQVIGPDSDGRCDLYSVGVILYEMLTGTVPFKSDAPDQMTHAAQIIGQLITMDNKPTAPRELNPIIHPDLEAVILNLLEKERDNRIPTAAEVRARLWTLYQEQRLALAST